MQGEFVHLSLLFPVASIDDYALLGSGGHLATQSGCRPSPSWGQLAPHECVQVNGIHAIVVM